MSFGETRPVIATDGPEEANRRTVTEVSGFVKRHPNILDGKYAINLWQPNDVLVDDYVFELEPNFTPGDYTVFMGLFSGDSRFRVTRGNQHDNRVIAGSLHVR